MKKSILENKDTPGVPNNESWHALSTEAVLDQLQVHENGLTGTEVNERQARYGFNQLSEAPRPGFWKLLWEQFNNFIVMLLIVASVISALLGEWNDASAILAIVLLNAVLGIAQERRAEEALAALKKLAAPEARVLRDGHRVTVSSHELVPGDIIFLEAGNHVPADVRLLEAVNLQVDESALTGESQPVQKNSAMVLEKNIPLGDRKNTAFMGTMVTYGRGRAVVIDTGMRSQLGLIARMLESVDQEETPLQKRLDQLGKTLGVGALTVCGVVFIVAVLRGTDLNILTSPGGGLLAYLLMAKKQIIDMFMLAVGLAIAAVPEGLPAVVTITLALGMREMIHRHALIRRLSSVETLGSATVICSDKTGTLTQNEMTVTRIWVDGQFVSVTGSGYSRRGEFQVEGKPIDLRKYPGVGTALWLGALNNDSKLESIEGDDQSYRIVGDPTEGSLLIAAAKADAYNFELDKAYPREDEVPFDADRKRMVTIHDIREPNPGDVSPFKNNKLRGWDVIAVKGAADLVLDLCTSYQTVADETKKMTPAIRQRILDANDLLTRDALRVLGLAYRVVEDAPKSESVSVDELEKDLVFVGLAGMIDPARPEVRSAMEKAAQAGIRTVMITGDYPNTARAIALEIGLLRPGHQVLTGADVDRMSDDILKNEIEQVDVFARVSPEHKMRIVDALQANGGGVGLMTPPLAVNGTAGSASAIASGGQHSCAIQAGTGTVVCWGPTAVAPPSSVNGTAGSASAIASGSYSCAIQAGSNAVICWDGDPYVDSTPPSSVDGTTGTASAIAAGGGHSCAIQSGTGGVVCWGNALYGEFTPPPSVDGTTGTASAISAGGGHSCAIQAGSGAVVCWGNEGVAAPPPSVNGTAGTASAIAAGGNHSCAIQAGTGTVVCWGSGYDGQATPPPSVDGIVGTASAIAAGDAHSCAIQASTGAVVCWGGPAPPPSVDGTAGTASAIAAGGGRFYISSGMGGTAVARTSCAIQAGTAAVVCWGGLMPPPSVDGTVGTASAIAVGGFHGCAIQAGTGAVVCWGALGESNWGQTTPPPSVDGTSGTASAIAAGFAHSCAIQSGTGAVVCWGGIGAPQPWVGVIGEPPPSAGGGWEPPPSVNGAAGTASAIASGGGHSCAIQAGTGAVICWGNDVGQAVPPSVNGTAGTASAIAAGGYHSCAIQAGTGKVVCWGSKSSWQATPSPSVDGTAGTATAIAAGGDHTLAIAAPEPGAEIGLAAGLLGLAVCHRFRRRHQG